jgi:hypothetical protein
VEEVLVCQPWTNDPEAYQVLGVFFDGFTGKKAEIAYLLGLLKANISVKALCGLSWPGHRCSRWKRCEVGRPIKALPVRSCRKPTLRSKTTCTKYDVARADSSLVKNN